LKNNWGHFLIVCLCIISSSIEHKQTERERISILLYAEGVPFEYHVIVLDALLETKIPPLLFVNLIKYESGWKNNAINRNVNGSVDRGLPQLNSFSLPHFRGYNNGNVVDPHNPSVSIPVAARHLLALYKVIGTWWGAIMAYNCGLTRFKSGSIPISTVRYALAITKEAGG
jgi:hypothetical protein